MRLSKEQAPRFIFICLGLGLLAALTLAACKTAAPDTTTPTTTSPPAQTGLPLAIFTTDDFAGSGNCASCHSNLTDPDGNDVSIDAQWRSTMMANSAKDPLWQAKVTSEISRNPALQEVIEDTCTVCHMPMAYTQAATNGTPIRLLDDGFLNPENALYEAAMDGQSCTVCHQIQGTNFGQTASFTGNYLIDTSTEPPNRLEFGPFPEPLQFPMQNRVGFTPVEGTHILDAELCATCHTVFTPYVDAQGNVLGTFPEQTPYLEWKNGVYGDDVGQNQPCQSCHVPQITEPVVISNTPSGLEGRLLFGQHYFVGGNAFMLRLLRDNIDAIGVTATSNHIEASIARLLANQKNRIHLLLTDGQLSGDTLEVTLKVDNQAGHKFPTGFPSRRTWVHMTVTDGSGQVIFESGRPNTDGSITGNDADADAAAYEPHYDVISQPNQVQIYEPIMIDSDGNVTYTLLRAASYTKDNRIPPRGFDKETAIGDIAVRGGASTDDNFIGGSDLITYRINTQGYSGPFTVTAKLLYQTVSFRFVQNLLQDSTQLILLFGSYYQDADKMPTQIAAIQRAFP